MTWWVHTHISSHGYFPFTLHLFQHFVLIHGPLVVNGWFQQVMCMALKRRIVVHLKVYGVANLQKHNWKEYISNNIQHVINMVNCDNKTHPFKFRKGSPVEIDCCRQLQITLRNFAPHWLALPPPGERTMRTVLLESDKRSQPALLHYAVSLADGAVLKQLFEGTFKYNEFCLFKLRSRVTVPKKYTDYVKYIKGIHI